MFNFVFIGCAPPYSRGHTVAGEGAGTVWLGNAESPVFCPRFREEGIRMGCITQPGVRRNLQERGARNLAHCETGPIDLGLKPHTAPLALFKLTKSCGSRRGQALNSETSETKGKL